MRFLKRQLPILLAFAAGMVFWLQYFVPNKSSQNLLETFTSSWAIIMFCAAFILGVLSAVAHHWSKISLRRTGYGYSAVALFVFGLMLLAGWFPVRPVNYSLIVGLLCFGLGVVWLGSYFVQRSSRPGKDSFSSLMVGLIFTVLGLINTLVFQPLTTGYLLFTKIREPYFKAQAIAPDSLFMWFFNHCFTPLDSTMFSLLAFYIASAAFRAFRARSFDATVLLIAGCLMMIGRVPLGETLALKYGVGHSLSITDISGWILNYPNMAAQRGILLGVILSQVAISLRIIFGIERTYMGGGE